jgi:hypothetical protein
MPSLVEELQRDALNNQVRVSDLLRKAKTIAVKLDLPELENWVESELNGYPPGDVPGYRVVRGKVKYRNIFHGWHPIMFPDTKTEEMFSKRNVFQRVAELEGLPEIAGGRDLQIPLSSEAQQLLMLATGCDDEMTIRVPSTAVVGILDAVRNALLEWSLKLEKAGVMGEGMSFSSDERKKAHETQTVYNIETIGAFTGNMGSGSANFTAEVNTINAESKAAIDGLIERIRSSEAQLGLERASAQKLRKNLAALEQEIKKGKPSGSRVADLLASIRNIAEGAVGSLAAQSILNELAKLMK